MGAASLWSKVWVLKGRRQRYLVTGLLRHPSTCCSKFKDSHWNVRNFSVKDTGSFTISVDTPVGSGSLSDTYFRSNKLLFSEGYQLLWKNLYFFGFNKIQNVLQTYVLNKFSAINAQNCVTLSRSESTNLKFQSHHHWHFSGPTGPTPICSSHAADMKVELVTMRAAPVFSLLSGLIRTVCIFVSFHIRTLC